MQKIIKNIYKDKIAAWSFSMSMGLTFLMLIIIGIFYLHLPPFLPLYNKMTWGYARLGNRWEIFLPLLLVIACVSLNTYVGIKLQSKIPLLARFVFVSSFAVSIFTVIFLGKILLMIL